MRLLVVEDDPVLSLIAEIALEEAGHEVICSAHDAVQAISLAEAQEFDLALVDINLDGNDEGIELVKILLQKFGLHSLFISGQIEVAKRHQNHAVGILVKPYTPEELIQSAAIARALVVGKFALSTDTPSTLHLFNATKGLYGADNG